MIEWYWALLFFVSLVCNGRAAFKLLVDWKGMLTTCRLVEDTYAQLAVLPDEAALERALRPELLKSILGDYDPTQVYVGCSDADSIPDRNIYRWLAGDVLATGGSLAYQGLTLSLANFARLGVRARTCAIQQSSIFIRVSIARLINEARRVAWFAHLSARTPGLARLLRPLFELGFRRSQICLGHNTF